MTVVASKYARQENDLYQTEPWVTEALDRRFPVDGLGIWEPSAGNHLMADTLKDLGANVITSDIKTYDRHHGFKYDFFGPETASPVGYDTMVANPPYGPGGHQARRWATLALDRCQGMVALLFTMKFDSGSTRVHLFRDNPRFAAKIVLLDRISWTLDGETGTEDHCWMVWRGIDEPQAPPVIFYEGREPTNGRE